MTTKHKILNVSIFLILILIILFQCEKGKPEQPLKENSTLLGKLEPLKAELINLRRLSDSLEQNYVRGKDYKDSVVISYKTKYIAVYDTITDEMIDCLPKPYVDTLIMTYETTLADCDTLVSTKNAQISNLEQQNSIKDTLIDNYQHNEVVYKNEVKKQKRKKWKFGFVGTGIGYILGKIF